MASNNARILRQARLLRWRVWAPLLLFDAVTLLLVAATYGLVARHAAGRAAPAALLALAVLLVLQALIAVAWAARQPLAQPSVAPQPGASPLAAPQAASSGGEPIQPTHPAVESEPAGSGPAAADDQVRNLLARLSHELRTPLNAIIGFIGLVEDGIYKSDQERRDYLRNARASAVALLEMINDILEYAKLASGQYMLTPGFFDPAELVASVVIFLGPQAHEKGLEIECTVDEALPGAMRGDAARLRQVLINLAGNAIKFTVAGQVLVRAEHDRAADGGDLLRLTVEDSGSGISAQDQQRMFDSFVQLNAGPAATRGGTGLGLAISKQLVTLMGGAIGVDSELGRGSRFWVTLPLVAGPTSAQPPVRPLEGRRLLLVAPLAAAAHAQASRLRRLGAAVDLAPTTALARSRLRSAFGGTPYHGLLIDDRFDTPDAATIADEVHARTGANALPLIYLSSSGVPLPDAVRRRLGFAAILAKPLAPQQVAMVLAPLLDRDAPPGDAAVALQMAEPPSSGSRRVLVAEDNAVNQKLIQALLTNAGCAVTLTANGSDAVDVLARQPHDLVLMDIQMPIMDGVTAAREIRRRLGHRSVPIVAMTANTADEAQQVGSGTVFDDYLSKPIDPRELTRILGQWVVSPTRRTTPAGMGNARGQSPHLDLKHLGDLAAYARAHEYRLYEDLLRLFQVQMENCMHRLHDAIAAEDWNGVVDSARTLRSACGSFGAPRLMQLAADMEVLGGEGLRVLVRDLEPQLASECRLLQQELQGRLAADAT